MEDVIRCTDCGRPISGSLIVAIVRRQCVSCQERQERLMQLLERRSAREVAALRG